MKKLTTVSYSILGFLAIEPHSAYELEKLLRGSGAQLVWPQTRSRIYDEPKNLVEHGLASAQSARRNGRDRVIYTITSEGRAELAEWLTIPGAAPSVEDEALLKVFYSSFADRAALEIQFEKIRADLIQRYEGLIGALEQLAGGSHVYPEREHMTDLLVRHYLKTLGARLAWLEEVETLTASWPDTQIDEPRLDQARSSSRELLDWARAALGRARRSVQV